MIPAIKNVLPLPDFVLELTFENGEKKHFDMKPYLDLGIFRDLKDPIKFKMVRVSFDTIEWDNEADMDPELLYYESKSILVNH